MNVVQLEPDRDVSCLNPKVKASMSVTDDIIERPQRPIVTLPVQDFNRTRSQVYPGVVLLPEVPVEMEIEARDAAAGCPCGASTSNNALPTIFHQRQRLATTSLKLRSGHFSGHARRRPHSGRRDASHPPSAKITRPVT